MTPFLFKLKKLLPYGIIIVYFQKEVSMKLLVTGGTVFASRYTAEYLVRAGHEVYVLNRGSKPQSPGVELICADRHLLGDRLRSLHFDAVIDVTAYNGKDINDLLDALGDFGMYIMISSSAVYPETLSQPFNEAQQTARNSVWGDYGTNKIEAEKALTARFPEAYILRPPYLYGKMNNLYREAFVFECAEKRLPFYLPKDGSMTLQFFDIGDMCRFILSILEIRPPQHIFNVGEPLPITVSEWVELCYSTVGVSPEFISVPADIPQRSYFPFYDYQYTLDVTEMSRIMPKLKPLHEGLAQSWEWFRENRSLIVRKPLLEFIEKELGGLK